MTNEQIFAQGYGIPEILFQNEMRCVRLAVGLRLVGRDMDNMTKENCRLRAVLAFTEHRLAEETQKPMEEW